MPEKITQPPTEIIISIVRDGAEIGDWPEDQVRDHFQNGQLVSTDLYWHEGMAEWKPLRDLVKPPLPAAPSALATHRNIPMSQPVLPPLPVIARETNQSPQINSNELVLLDRTIPIWIEVFGYVVLLFVLSMLSDVTDDIRNNLHPSPAGRLGGTMAYMLRDGVILTIVICFFKRHARKVFLIGLILLTLLHLA
jgi:hypothetical protein